MYERLGVEEIFWRVAQGVGSREIGNGFRAIGVIAALEEDLGRPVLTANQVAFWYALREAGVRASVNGYGRLFSTLNSERR